MFFHVSVAKIMFFIQLSKPFSRIANADIRYWRIADPPELDLFSCFSILHKFSFGHRAASCDDAVQIQT
jgi:hypothetical protein